MKHSTLRKHSALRPAALALAGMLSFGLVACDDTDTGNEIGEEINDDAEGAGLGGGDVGTDDLDSSDAGE